jgi:hypothetical protein
MRRQTFTEEHHLCTAPSRRCIPPELLKTSAIMKTTKCRQSSQYHPCLSYRNSTLNREANYLCRAKQYRTLV